jgi:hypothetical protein
MRGIYSRMVHFRLITDFVVIADCRTIEPISLTNQDGAGVGTMVLVMVHRRPCLEMSRYANERLFGL